MGASLTFTFSFAVPAPSDKYYGATFLIVLGDAIILETCYPFYFIGSAPQRFIVRANAATEPGSQLARDPFMDPEAG